MNKPETLLLVAIALPVPLGKAFDYQLLECEIDVLRPGVRVRVPFGSRELIGLVLQAPRWSPPAHARYKFVAEVLDAAPIAPPDWLPFLLWATDYYLHPVGEVIAAAVPLAMRDGAPAVFVPKRALHLSAAGRAALPALSARAHRQRALLQTLLEGPAAEAALPAAAVRRFIEQGWVHWQQPSAWQPIAASKSSALTPAQHAALVALQPSETGFAVRLLDGVTGSGKTELYLELAAQTLAKGQQVLVLVPEIGLTPQLMARFTQRFGAAVGQSHSGMTEAGRLGSWLGVREGIVQVLVGTRSAVFAPFARLGLVVVDEEHDVSFKQQDGFRYHARDLAIVRAQKAGALVVLGSATPSLESLANARARRYTRVALSERVAGLPPPKTQLIDLNHFPARQGLSAPLAAAVTRHVEAGGQALLFINRRGYAPTLFCDSCHWLAPCPHCDARLTVHRGSGLCCHHCGYRCAPPKRCPACGGQKLLALGEGTERLEEALKNLLPGKRVERFDSERFSTAKQLHALLDEVRSQAVDVLVGTQMLAKGHDFGSLSLVGVVNADQALFSADFRATERLGQLLTQVAGRAGRKANAAIEAEVLIQTRDPAHPALQTLLTRGYGEFAKQLLAERKQAGLPPYAYMALLRAESGVAAEAMAFLKSAAACFPPSPHIQVLGPAPALMERRANRHRAQLMIQSTHRRALKAHLATWLQRLAALPLARQLRWSLDVDPADLF